MMSNLRLFTTNCFRHFNQIAVHDIKTVRVSHKLCRNYSTVSPTQEPTKSQSEEPVIGITPESLPLAITRELRDMHKVNPKVTPIREVWVENMSSVESKKLAIVSLHPSVFGAFPRVDLIQENHKWQTLYKHIDWKWLPVRHELSGPKSKPWPQKGTGRARARGYRAPQWIHGAYVTGPRGPKTHFYLLPFHKRVKGLVSMLSAKLAQDDLKVVDTLDSLSADTGEHMEELCDARGWGPSVLFVDKSDIFPRNISVATDSIKHINLMPVYGLNVFSMLKHETLVLTLEAVEEIEKKLLFHLKRTDLWDVMSKIKSSKGLHL